MSDTLTVSIYPDADAIDADAPTVLHDVDFVSFVNEGTFGPPALVAPKPGARPGEPGHRPVARAGQEVVYVNTSLIPLFKIERNGDEG